MTEKISSADMPETAASVELPEGIGASGAGVDAVGVAGLALGASDQAAHDGGPHWAEPLEQPAVSLPPPPPSPPPAPVVESVAPALRCKNCQAVLVGRYCMNCGQAADVHVPSTGELLHEALEGLTHSDSRLWRTLLWLWFKPGVLTNEFFIGRRMSYLPPFRLYLIISLMFFLTLSFSHGSRVEIVSAGNSTVHASDPKDLPCDNMVQFFGSMRNPRNPAWDQRLNRACLEIRRDNGQNLQKGIFATLPKAMFVFLPLLAFLNMLLYWRPRHRYAEHLVFFLHLQAFFFSMGILMILVGACAGWWPTLAGASNGVQTLLGLSLPVYTVLAMRRVFNNSWPLIVLKALALAVIYLAVFAVAFTAVFMYSALQL
jgi:hypothetical protein